MGVRTGAMAVTLLLLAAGAARAQGPAPDPARIAAQAEAMRPLAWMDGVWRGAAWYATPAGRQEMIHTERVGPMLASSVKVIEGLSYAADGGGAGAGFNALAVISHDPDRGLSMRSYAQGRAGDFPLTLTPDGWRWSAGPVSYSTVHKDGVWTEDGVFTPPAGGPSRRVFHMEMRRVSSTDWPAAGRVRAEVS